MLTNDLKRTQFDISRYLVSCYEDDPSDFIERDVTQDETWVHHFDPESKMQSKQWKHPCSPLLRNLRKFIQQGSDGLNLLGQSRATINDYLEQGRTINGAYYAGELRWLRRDITRKR